MRKILAILAVTLVFAIDALAEVPFNGLLLDAAMQPVKKAKVYVKNPRRYATSDKQGRFGLTDVQPDDTITIVLKKKQIIRIPVDGRKSLKIILAGDGSALWSGYDEEIANTGYGYVRRREYTGVSTGISGEKLVATGERDILGALKGLVAGLIITGSQGNYTVNMRGLNSMHLSSAPIYIVDGVEVDTIDYISIYDVDHVEVVKDGMQYGAKGSNGAILVTTKHGPKK